jgi:hypothetical protein
MALSGLQQYFFPTPDRKLFHFRGGVPPYWWDYAEALERRSTPASRASRTSMSNGFVR